MTFSVPLWVLWLLALPLIVVGSVALALGLWLMWQWATHAVLVPWAWVKFDISDWHKMAAEALSEWENKA